MGLASVPGVRAVATYRLSWRRRDVRAGVVLTTLLVPQGMLPIPGSNGSPERAIALASMLVLLVGAVMIVAGVARLGFAGRRLSSGEAMGAAVAIGGFSLLVILSLGAGCRRSPVCSSRSCSARAGGRPLGAARSSSPPREFCPALVGTGCAHSRMIIRLGLRRSPRRHGILRVWGRAGAMITSIVGVLAIATALKHSERYLGWDNRRLADHPSLPGREMSAADRRHTDRRWGDALAPIGSAGRV